MRRRIERIYIGPEYVLRAVAVMHVEIDDGDSLVAVNRARMQRTDRDVVEQAKAHGARAFGMMAGRPHGAERIVQPARMDFVDGCDGGA